jgi:LPS-assembly protein
MPCIKINRLRRALLPLCALGAMAVGTARVAVAQVQTRERSQHGLVEIETDTVKGKKDDVVTYEGHVEIRYQDRRIRADHVEYNQRTGDVTATGHVQFDYENQHLDADDATYNRDTDRGLFHNVHGAIKMHPSQNGTLLVTANPLTFEAVEVERLDDETYKIRDARLTICNPDKPTWQFFAPRATLHLGSKVALVNANFRLYRVPLFWLPYATTPAGKNVRESGFLIPTAGQSSRKGFIFGDSYYWAPKEWMDATIGGQLMSRRGWSQSDEVRARPWENVSLTANYFGVVDRGLPDANGIRQPQGGHETKISFDALLANGWHAAADVDQLSSLTFRLAFSETFGEAVNAEANTTTFMANNFRGLSLSFGILSDKYFLSAQPQTSVVIRNMPQVDLGSVDQSVWKNLPIYFGFDASVGGMYRSDPNITTPAIVQRSEVSPRITVPLHWGRYLGVTSTFAFRATRYGAQLVGGSVSASPVVRLTGELTVDVRLPTFERIYGSGDTKWKHSIEPDFVYRRVSGVNDFGRFIRFDSDETLTDTNEIEYGITNRFYRKSKSGSAEEIVTWRLVQKYYFDPTFGGALVPGQRNVFQAFDSISPFAFADLPRHYSPIVSDLLITPGGRYDAESRIEYDTERNRVTSIGTLLKMHPYEKFTVTLAHFDINENAVLQPRSNQIRALVGYGDQSHSGWNFTGGFSFDIQQHFLQNQIVQIGYNGSCCGLQFEYRRIALGAVRTENQFRIALVIANIGSFGNVHKQDKIF